MTCANTGLDPCAVPNLATGIEYYLASDILDVNEVSTGGTVKIQNLNRPKSLTEITLERLRDAIIEDEIALGTQLSELKLSKSLGVSKTPIREALQELRREGLVRVDPQVGTFVFQITGTDIDQICTCRRILEVGAARGLYEVDRTETIKALKKIVTDMGRIAEKGDALAYVKLDSEFHLAIVRGTQNSYLMTSYRPLASQIEAIRSRNLKSAEVLARSVGVHREILKTLEQDDCEAFVAIIERHIEQSRLDYLDWSERTGLQDEA